MNFPVVSNDQEKDRSPPAVAHDIFGDGSAIIVRGVLSPSECKAYIDHAESSGLRPCGYRDQIRVTGRLQIKSVPAATALFNRIKPVLKPFLDLQKEENQPRGIVTNQRRWKWYTCGLNECFRLCRYDPGGFFLPHHGGGYARSEFERSMSTFMIYLNDDFEGGATNFYHESQTHYRPGDPSKVVYSYQPRAGDAVIFHSRIVHDGGLVTDGQKYIMRSEVMYSAIEPIDEDSKASPPNRTTKAN